LETAPGSMIRERACSDESSGIKSFTYHLIRDHGRSTDWALAKSRYRPEYLELIPWDVARPDRFHFGLRWERYFRFQLCFAPDEGFLVDRGAFLKTSFRRWVGLDGGVITDSWPRGIHPIPANIKRGGVSSTSRRLKQLL